MKKALAYLVVLCFALLLASCASNAPSSGIKYSLTATRQDGATPTKHELDLAISALQERLSAAGYKAYDVEPSDNNSEIIIKLPEEKPVLEPSIIKNGQLEFAIVQDKYTSIMDEDELNRLKGEGEPVLGPVLLTGDKITSAKAIYGGQYNSRPAINISFDTEGGTEFAQITGQSVNKRLAIVLDGKIITAPNIIGPIPDGKAVIEGIKSIDEAKEIAIVLSHPISLELSVKDKTTFSR
ncbi:MAG TPA: hypothetical protein VE439_00155 [Anaerolineae bacterium]|nr:hypothetical protein [Anaerolineae bacterium]